MKYSARHIPKILSWYDAQDVLAGKNRRKLANNTYLEIRNELDTCVKLHNTDIITYQCNGPIILHSGGWRTVTTKQRMNQILGGVIGQEKRIWYVYWNGARYTFNDGIELWQQGVENVGPPIEDIKKQHVAIKKYVREYIDQLAAEKIEKPSNGDCMYCHLFGTNAECVQSHIEEEYYVPSLLLRFLNSWSGKGMSRAALDWCGGRMYKRRSMLPADSTWVQAQVRKRFVLYLMQIMGV